jgi:hypothetical protein
MIEEVPVANVIAALQNCPVVRALVKRKTDTSDDVRFDVFTAETMKNGVFWDIKPHFVLHRRHITSPLQSPAS